MKNTIKSIIILFLSVVAIISSCKKDNPITTASPINNSNCKVASFSQDGKIAASFEYNTDGKLVKETKYDDGVLDYVVTYSYVTDKITETTTFSTSVSNNTTYYLASNGFAHMSVSGLDTILYTQDNNGYLIKQETKSDITVFTISNGNTVKSIRNSKDSSVSRLDSAYATFYSEQLAGSYVVPGNFTGKADKNLMNTFSSTAPKIDETFIWTIENDLVTKAMQKESTQSHTDVISYQCK